METKNKTEETEPKSIPKLNLHANNEVIAITKKKSKTIGDNYYQPMPVNQHYQDILSKLNNNKLDTIEKKIKQKEMQKIKISTELNSLQKERTQILDGLKRNLRTKHFLTLKLNENIQKRNYSANQKETKDKRKVNVSQSKSPINSTTSKGKSPIDFKKKTQKRIQLPKLEYYTPNFHKKVI